MKLHLVAASEILSKNLDPFFPHNQLGEDGLLVAQSQQESEPPAVFISTVEAESVTIETPENTEAPQEQVAEPLNDLNQEPKLELADEEKSQGKMRRGRKAH